MPTSLCDSESRVCAVGALPQSASEICLALLRKTARFTGRARETPRHQMMAKGSHNRDRGCALQSGHCVRSERAWAAGGDLHRGDFRFMLSMDSYRSASAHRLRAAGQRDPGQTGPIRRSQKLSKPWIRFVAASGHRNGGGVVTRHVGTMCEVEKELGKFCIREVSPCLLLCSLTQCSVGPSQDGKILRYPTSYFLSTLYKPSRSPTTWPIERSCSGSRGIQKTIRPRGWKKTCFPLCLIRRRRFSVVLTR